MNHELKPIANYLYEAGMLNKTPRSWTGFLGTGEQSVAEHMYRMLHIVYALAKMEKVNLSRMLEMAMFHDFAEGRVSDLNYVHQKYVTSDEEKAMNDLTKTLPFGDSINEVLSEYKTRETLESKLVKDADNIELLLSLKEQQSIGNPKAEEWMSFTEKRIKTDAGKQLAEVVLATHPDEWWFSDKDKQDDWWVTRHGKKG